MPRRSRKLYATHALPHYVTEYLGGRRGLSLERVSRRCWLFSGFERGLLIRATTAIDARYRAREAVAHLSPKTDRRRCHWEYT